ncbi:MAG: hypothetical protein Kow0069_00140 [Promethearchaeota archaeon]
MDDYTMAMFFIFGGLAVVGYFVCALQLKLVRKEVWNWADRLRCGFFGFFFAAGISVIVAVGFIFATGDPTLNPTGPQATLGDYMAFVMVGILAYLTVYPLVDFLLLAKSETQEGLTPFQQFLERKLIDRFRPPASYGVAVALYAGIVLAPPLLIGVATSFHNFLIVWISWAILIPIAIIAYYGSMGYVAGIFTVYYHVPYMGRSLFVGFESGQRAMEDFKNDPASRILLGLMIFVYVWTWVSLFQTIGLAAPGGRPLVNTAGAAATVFLVLLFGIVGYFSRFWGRKIKFRTRDVLFAAYIIAAVGLNVMINFLILNQNPLYGTFSGSRWTRPLVSGAEAPWSGNNPNPSRDYLGLVPAAIIEETVLVVVITYYFVNRSAPFVRNSAHALITRSRQTFDPVPLFNFVTSDVEALQRQAHEAIVEVYGRLPNRTELDFTASKYVNPLTDALCDYDPRARKAAAEALLELERTAGALALPIVLACATSPNVDKRLPALEALLAGPDDLLLKFPRKPLHDMLGDWDWRVRLVAVRLVSRVAELDATYGPVDLVLPLLDDPDNDVQASAIHALLKLGARVPASAIFSRIDHPNQKVRTAAVAALGSVDLTGSETWLLPLLGRMVQDPNWHVRLTAFEAMAKIGDAEGAEVPAEVLVEGLKDPNELVRAAAGRVLANVLERKPKAVDAKLLLKTFKEGDAATKRATIPALGALLSASKRGRGGDLLGLMLDALTHPDEAVKEAAAEVLARRGGVDPIGVVERLVGVPEQKHFVKKGVVSSTVIRVAQERPKEVIPFLLKVLEEGDDAERTVAATTIGEVGALHPELFDPQVVARVLLKDPLPRVRQLVSKSISEVVEREPARVKNIVVNLIQGLSDENENVRIAISKTLQRISKLAPELVPIPPIVGQLEEKDVFTREALVKVLGHVGHRLPDQAVPALVKAMGDPEWIVRNAAAEALGTVATAVPEGADVAGLLVKALDDEDKWVRSSATAALLKLVKKSPGAVPVDAVVDKVKAEADEQVLKGYVQILGEVASDNFGRVKGLLVECLQSSSGVVRDAAVTTFVRVSGKVPLESFLTELLKLLADEVPLPTQRSVAVLLKRLVKYEREDVKKRVVPLLRIRCEMSQDEVICGALQELESG